MYALTLNDEERDLLEEVLHETISELRMEIADTDSHDYRAQTAPARGHAQGTWSSA